MTDDTKAAKVEFAVRRWSLVATFVAAVASILGYQFGYQLGFFAGLSSGSWPRNATGAVLSGVLSSSWGDALRTYLMLWAFLTIAGNLGARSHGGYLAFVRTVVAKGVKDTPFWIRIILTTGFLLSFFLGPGGVQFVLIMLLILLLLLLAAAFIAAIKSPVRQVSALALLALSMGFGSGFFPGEPSDEIDCVGDKELVLRSGERLACVTSKVTWRLKYRKFMIVQGPAASTLVWLTDVEPESLRRAFGDAATRLLPRAGN